MPAAETTATTSFSSPRLAFTIDVPSGWRVNAAYLDWEIGTAPHRGTPPFDTLRSEGSDPWILVGRQSLRSTATLERWFARLLATETITYPGVCKEPELDSSGTLGGEPARVIGRRCPGDQPQSIAVQLLAVHGDGGYLAMCFSEETFGGDLDALLAACRDWLASFAFVD